ncbi:hypothetical protein MK280_00315 [Myxococcota bacterium]|nr:hypothetical protein [Myxococcota bacterium]
MLVSPAACWAGCSAYVANALRIGGPGTGLKRIWEPQSWGRVLSGLGDLSAIVVRGFAWETDRRSISLGAMKGADLGSRYNRAEKTGQGSRFERLVGLCGLLLSIAGGVSAEAQDLEQAPLDVTGTAESPKSSAPPVSPLDPSVELDQLLKLPSSMDFEQQERNGVTAEAWKARFRESSAEIQAAQAKISKTMEELDGISGQAGAGQWQMAPPGASSNTDVTPLSFRLREQLREQRVALEAVESKYRDLVIQADLAGVPDSWRTPPPVRTVREASN